MADPTTQEEGSNIVCPLCLLIAEKSEGRSGSIQSYRCLARANGWETRPQKTDKWAEDFYRVLRTPKGEKVQLTDGKTIMGGLGKGDTKVFKFTQKDGELAYKRAMKDVMEGVIRAPRNWDRTFADDAGITADELKEKFPQLYATQSRTTSRDEDEAIEELGAGFFGDEMPDVEATSEEEEEDEETSEVEEEEDVAAGAYSVTAELGLDEEQEMETEAATNEETQTGHEEGEFQVIGINYPHPKHRLNIDDDVEMINVPIGRGRWKRFYRIQHPTSKEFVFMPEGEQDDNSWIRVDVRGKPSARQ